MFDYYIVSYHPPFMVHTNFICVKHWETFPKNIWKTPYIQHFFSWKILLPFFLPKFWYLLANFWNWNFFISSVNLSNFSHLGEFFFNNKIKKNLSLHLWRCLLNQKERTYTYYLGGARILQLLLGVRSFPCDVCVCVYDYNKVFLVLYNG